MDNAKSQLVDRLKSANSVLITVSRNPTVDQLAACIGLTLLVNKLGKHGSAVFSGAIPSIIEFLKPEETIEKTPDSLRDFIIALDKSKADKLRYKVEDQMVKIFISPYKTSLSEKDLEFSQGDFNVELVIALGVKNQEDLDQAIVSHGRILHDATVACINTSEKADLGTINWQDPAASSLCELVTDLAQAAGQNLLDQQIATALLTGIIAETDRFSNEKTSSQTMSVSGQLMAAGANQQLVATNLSEQLAKPIENSSANQAGQSGDGTLSIDHDKEDLDISTLPKPTDQSDNLANTDQGVGAINPAGMNSSPPKLVTEPPTLGGMLTANSMPEQYDPSIDPLTNVVMPGSPTSNPSPVNRPVRQPSVVPPAPQQAYTPPPPTWLAPPAPQATTPIEPPVIPQPTQEPIDTSPHPDKTLKEIEQAVNSPHLEGLDPNAAREQIDAIISGTPGSSPQPDLALNALPLGQPLHDNNKDNKPVINTTGLDPSLFSELPAKDKAPPVPPPVRYPINGNNNEIGDDQTKP